MLIPLTRLYQDSRIAVIQRIDARPDLRRRLFDLGFVPGAAVTPLFHNRSLYACGIGGSVIALRHADAAQIQCSYPAPSEEEQL